MNKLSAIDMRKFIRGIVKENEPMTMHTTYGVGGPADIYIEPADEADLIELLKWTNEQGVPWVVIGDGTNLLVSDIGIRGVVIRMSKPFSRVTIDGERVIAGSGAILAKVIDAAVDAGLSGLEYATAVPGTIGGAVIMNAGTHLGYVGNSVEEVRVIKADGTVENLSHDDLKFSYRRSALQGDKSRVVTQATFRLQPGDKEYMVRMVQQLKQRRNETQPTIGRSCGCVFKNPDGGKAGQLIEQAGLKGKRLGDAMIPDRHANFILNTANATAADIRGLAEEVRAIVQEKFGIRLEYEVRVIGDWTGFEKA